VPLSQRGAVSSWRCLIVALSHRGAVSSWRCLIVVLLKLPAAPLADPRGRVCRGPGPGSAPTYLGWRRRGLARRPVGAASPLRASATRIARSRPGALSQQQIQHNSADDRSSGRNLFSMPYRVRHYEIAT